MSIDFRSGVSIFWSESAMYVLAYAIFALVVCAILSALEFHNQTSNLGSSRVAAKGGVILAASIVCFTLSLYISSWQASALGGEIVAFFLVTALWLAATFFLNRYATEFIGLTFSPVKRYTVFPVLVLVLPFVLFSVFIFMLGSAWKN